MCIAHLLAMCHMCIDAQLYAPSECVVRYICMIIRCILLTGLIVS